MASTTTAANALQAFEMSHFLNFQVPGDYTARAKPYSVILDSGEVYAVKGADHYTEELPKRVFQVSFEQLESSDYIVVVDLTKPVKMWCIPVADFKRISTHGKSYYILHIWDLKGQARNNQQWLASMQPYRIARTACEVKTTNPPKSANRIKAEALPIATQNYAAEKMNESKGRIEVKVKGFSRIGLHLESIERELELMNVKPDAIIFELIGVIAKVNDRLLNANEEQLSIAKEKITEYGYVEV